MTTKVTRDGRRMRSMNGTEDYATQWAKVWIRGEIAETQGGA